MKFIILFILVTNFYFNHAWDEDPGRMPTKCENFNKAFAFVNSEKANDITVKPRLISEDYYKGALFRTEYQPKDIACKFLTIELTEALKKLDSSDVIENGYKVDDEFLKRSSKKYQDSELRLIEAVTQGCRNLLDYHVHSKRPGSLRFSKEEHPTMKAFKHVRKHGGEVDIGVPSDMWDIPEIEIMRLKRSCDTMIEMYEEDIEDWYFHHRDIPLMKYLCEGIVLKDESKRCLYEKESPYKKEEL